MAKSTKKQRPADKARKEYDQRLTDMNKRVRELMKAHLGDSVPTCPTCKSQNAKSLSTRHGLLVGIKPTYRCMDCNRTYVGDDDRYRNVWLKYRAICMVQFGGMAMAQEAIKMLHDYGVNADYTDIYRWLKSMSGARVI